MVPAKKLKIAFVHPDLGIGGAERLVVDAALGLQEAGHEVIIYTSHCDKTHCFEEVKNGTLKVEVFGDFLPTDLGKRFFIVFANLRQLYLTAKVVLSGRSKDKDVFIIDQLSTCVPFFKLANNKVLFYCHFPDQLLAIRTNWIKSLYRIPFDLLEQFTMYCSDEVVVNSNFTKSMKPLVGKCPNFYLSINRYERKKNIELAIQAFAKASVENTNLVVCGGYDPRIHENVQYLQELTCLCKELDLSYTVNHYSDFIEDSYSVNEIEKLFGAKVIFLTSISSSLKEFLIQNMQLLLYTPSYEHFGIVPLEAMKYGKPVLAVNNGGPVETVVSYQKEDNEKSTTGWLRSADADEWASALIESKEVLNQNPELFKNNGPKRVIELFSRKAMTQEFETNIKLALRHTSNISIIYVVSIIFAVLLKVFVF
ncbi:Glycosyltransferase Family 4 [Nakaseomyces glabratus]